MRKAKMDNIKQKDMLFLDALGRGRSPTFSGSF